MAERISAKDLGIIRDLAKTQLEYAKSEKMIRLKEEWLAHNTFSGTRPMVYIEMGTFANEVVPPLLKCEGEEARNIESRLYGNFLNHSLFEDDAPVPDYFPIFRGSDIKLFNLDVRVTKTDGLGHQFEHVITDLEKDWSKLEKSTYYFNKEKSEAEQTYINELIGGILPAKIIGRGLYAVPTQKVVHLMGMENMLYSMYDYPELFKEMMDRIADDYIECYNIAARQKMVLPTTRDEWLGQGTWCFTNELAGDEEFQKRPFSAKDVWGFMDSQETVGISPEMFMEFIAPCYEKIAEGFGLLSYGCCEPVDPIWDCFLSKLENLRKVSISPWCNEEIMGEKLANKKVIYQRKPSPNYLGVGKNLDEEAFAAHIRKTAAAAKNCKLEITQRDVYTIAENPQKVKRYVEIIRNNSIT